MKTTDWKFDFGSLPRWENHSLPYTYDEFYEIPQADALVCIYAIREVSMLNYLGFLAILKNKQNPRLVLNITDTMQFTGNFSVNGDGDRIFLQASMYRKETNTVTRPILIIDVKKSLFSFFKTENTNTCYRVVELRENVFGIDGDARQMKYDKRLKELSGQTIRADSLQWYDFAGIGSLPEML